jgi:hypothetical protein
LPLLHQAPGYEETKVDDKEEDGEEIQRDDFPVKMVATKTVGADVGGPNCNDEQTQKSQDSPLHFVAS